MKERQAAVTFLGNPLTLVGDELTVGSKIPDLELLDNSLNAVKLSSYKGKVLIVTAVPSLDTPVCDVETRRFNQEAASLGPSMRVLTVSMDLPFAQKRWCGSAGIEWVQTLSDHRDARFGTGFGVLIKELRLLARAIFVVDREGIVRYTQLVKEISQEPNYDAAIEAARQLL